MTYSEIDGVTVCRVTLGDGSRVVQVSNRRLDGPAIIRDANHARAIASALEAEASRWDGKRHTIDCPGGPLCHCELGR